MLKRDKDPRQQGLTDSVGLLCIFNLVHGVDDAMTRIQASYYCGPTRKAHVYIPVKTVQSDRVERYHNINGPHTQQYYPRIIDQNAFSMQACVYICGELILGKQSRRSFFLLLAGEKGIDGRVELIAPFQEVELKNENIANGSAAELLYERTCRCCRTT